MVRSVSFGRRGEAEWHRLEVTLRLEKRGAYTLVVSDNWECLAEARRRLVSLVPSLTSIVPDEKVVVHIADIDRAPESSDGAPIPVVWLHVDVENEETDRAWREALSALNQRRDHLRDIGPVLVVLAGPRALRDIVARRAPDLFSVLNPKIVDLGDDTEALIRVTAPLQWLHLSDLHIQKRW